MKAYILRVQLKILIVYLAVNGVLAWPEYG